MVRISGMCYLKNPKQGTIPFWAHVPFVGADLSTGGLGSYMFVVFQDGILKSVAKYPYDAQLILEYTKN
jgi:hypothetical protein